MRFIRIATPEGMSFATSHEGTARQIDATPFTKPTYTGKEWEEGHYRLLAPMLPSKLVGIMEEDATLKPPTCVSGPGAAVKIPGWAAHVAVRPGLAAVISTPCKDVAAEQWRRYVIGFSLVADLQAQGSTVNPLPGVLAGTQDGFNPMGPWISTDLSFDSLQPEVIVRRQDGSDERQSAPEMAGYEERLAEAVEIATEGMTMLPGDTIFIPLTEELVQLSSGDSLHIRAGELGELRFTVAAE